MNGKAKREEEEEGEMDLGRRRINGGINGGKMKASCERRRHAGEEE
jgi:hypothetical protein